MTAKRLKSVIQVEESSPHLFKLCFGLHCLIQLTVLSKSLKVRFKHRHGNFAAVWVQIMETISYHTPVVVDRDYFWNSIEYLIEFI